MKKTKETVKKSQSVVTPAPTSPTVTTNIAFYGSLAQHLHSFLKACRKTKKPVVEHGNTVVRKIVEMETHRDGWWVYEEEVGGRKRWLNWSAVVLPQGLTVFLEEAWEVRQNPNLRHCYERILVKKVEEVFLNSHHMRWEEEEKEGEWLGRLVGKDNETEKSWYVVLYERGWGDIIKKEVFERWKDTVYLEWEVKTPKKKQGTKKQRPMMWNFLRD